MKENAKENELVKKLTNKHYTITTAESCTGGLLSATIINVSGASDVINCAYVTYANEAKENLVSVSHETLETKGAVSKETAAEMCVGCAKAAKADMGLSTTGIAATSIIYFMLIKGLKDRDRKSTRLNSSHRT